MPPHPHHHDQPPPPKPNPNLLSSILKALIMTFITSFFFLILGFVAFLLFLILAAGALHRRRNQLDLPFSSSGFSPRHFKTLPQFRFRTQNETASSDCVVCLDAFREGQWCRKLPACGHLFHRKCLDTWLVKVSACPICRTSVRFDLGNAASTSDLEDEEEAKPSWNCNRNTNSRVW